MNVYISGQKLQLADYALATSIDRICQQIKIDYPLLSIFVGKTLFKG
ncbi:protein of unknown function [Vibrio tapetis subsp. tapetis]|uniref:Uncharacterized protein n=1 Tax=Vibrio tapetis subsp. tapetis TaxID=1671868 RepID=A0A2N8ZIE9_9VIBR|nr:protein of unknown function [Vibrio tapetis subsp. tapetis]